MPPSAIDESLSLEKIAPSKPGTNHLAAYGADQTRRAALGDAVLRDRDAVDLVLKRYASGVTSFIEVLDAERTLQQNQLSLTDGSTAVSIDLVVLFKALGGGWDATLYR
jgi:outer membrane protein TolC